MMAAMVTLFKNSKNQEEKNHFLKFPPIAKKTGSYPLTK
jgi:hypothetical protein